ncbi:MAG: hypothetical protein FWE19_08740 [Oscillospiraceae bacterium]|nr:hypothetical protein [Oscillospiraceae bacterium]
MKQVDPCQLNAAIAVITNQLYCSMSRQDFTNLGVVLSMLSRSIISMAALEELLRWEHRDLRAERQLREAKERREKRRSTPGLRPGHAAAEEVHQRKEELIDEESLIAAEEGELIAEEELLFEEEL